MALNDIHLPASLVEELYKNLLTGSDSPQPFKTAIPGNASPKKGIQYLGENQKGICLLVDYANDVYLPDNELHFLTSILQACKLNLGDVAIINHHQQKISFKDLIEQMSCNYLLVFGLKAASIDLEEIQPFTIAAVHDCHIVYSPATGELNNNSPESKLWKSKLWNCLKQLFGI
ncbi:MAG: hypothetical protein NVSMB7_03510 [Chitinophagaceae bacterium]